MLIAEKDNADYKLVLRPTTRSIRSDLPMAKMAGPKRPRFWMIFLIDFGREPSIRPRSPSEVPEACIILCMVRMTCFKSKDLVNGSSPAKTDECTARAKDKLAYRKRNT